MTEYRSRILAIDDTPSNLQTLGAALAGEFELQIATSGEVGISLAFRFSPDLILLDIMMPGLDGFEVCRRLKASDQLKDIPVVFVTALREIESESDGLMMGAADYITKPFNVEIVRQRIRNLLERERLRRDVQDQQRMLAARVEELENTQSKLLLVSDALHKSDAFNLAVLNSLPDHIAVIDQSGNICEVNDAWRQFAQENGGNSSLTGSRVDIGTNYLEVCRTAVDSTSSEMTEILRGIEGVLSGQLKIFSAEYACHSPTQQRWFVMNVTPLGDTTGAVIAHSDVTERTVAVHRMERMLLEQTAILDNEIIGIVKVKNRIILWANAAFEHMLGYGHGELAGIPTRQNYLNDKAYLDFGRAAYPTLAKDQVFRAPIEHVKKDGSRIWLSLSGAMLNSETGESLWAFVDITEQRINEERVAASELRLRTIIETDPECIKTIDAQGRLKQMNPAGLALIQAENIDQVKGLMVEGLITADHRNAFRHLHQQVISGTSGQLTFEIVGLKGGHRWLETYAVPMKEDGQSVLLAITRDVTERRKYDQQIQLAASVFASAREGVTITSSDGTIVDVNAAFTRITGYTREEVLGKNPRILNSGRQAPEFYAQLWNQVLDQGHWSGELWNRRKSGEIYAEFLTITAVRDSEGLNQHFVGLFSDITSVKLHQEELKHIAHYDALTGLANRVLLSDRMSQSMLQAHRRNLQLAVVFLDLDGFKAVNDKHGHLAGDNLLIALANGMKNTLRECDTLARIGGDEFVAVLGDLTERSDVIPMLDRLIAVTSTPILFGDKVLQVSSSLGVTYYPQSSDIDAGQLLRQADQAMYKAKISGKNQYSFFDVEMDDGIRRQIENTERLRSALVNREFVLHFQPILNLRTGKLVSVEALIRWMHPERGLLAPLEFLPAIEGSELSIELGEWILDSVLSQSEHWSAQGLSLSIAVNVSAFHLQKTDFTARLQEMLAKHPTVSPSSLTIEILETSALEDLDHVSRVIEDCQMLGVQFALDDFGTGYSSLTYLRRLEVDKLKIDRSFVHGMLDDAGALAIADGVIGLSRAFNCDVIAEGIESEEQKGLLLKLGCCFGQGYLISKAMPASEVLRWDAGRMPIEISKSQEVTTRSRLPLIYASVEHRTWINAMEEHLRGFRRYPPPMDKHQCNLGRWLDSEGKRQFGAHPIFDALLICHSRVHETAAEVMELQRRGENAQAFDMLPKIKTIRDELLQYLDSLSAIESIQ